MGWWDNNSSGLIGAGTGAITGIIQGIGQRKREERSMNNQQKLMGIQNQNQMDLNRQGQELGMKTWRETSYKPQMEMMKEAGLNPAMMYGMSGGGGQTTNSGSGGSAQGGNAPQPQPMEIGNMLQASLLKAQKENIEADTANKKADIPVKEGEAVLKGTQNKSLLQGIKNQEAQEALIKIQQNIGSKTLEKLGAETRSALLQADVDQATVQEKTDMLRAEYGRIILEKGLTETKGNILKSEKVVAEFEAEMARNGISPNAPWYAKLLTDILEEYGLMGLIKGRK